MKSVQEMLYLIFPTLMDCMQMQKENIPMQMGDIRLIMDSIQIPMVFIQMQTGNIPISMEIIQHNIWKLIFLWAMTIIMIRNWLYQVAQADNNYYRIAMGYRTRHIT